MTILEFLYNTVPGRFLLKPLTGPRLSRICGHFLDSELSSFSHSTICKAKCNPIIRL